MKTQFAFGKHGIEVTVPEGFDCQVVRSRAAQALDNVAGALEAALDHPIHSEPLEKLAAGKRTAGISVCDITRPAPNRITLPPLLKRLHAAGIPKEGVTILIATGLHRAATTEELDIILGPEIAATYNVVSHDARNFAAHRSVGTTRRGTPVYIDERFVAADLHITLGFIEPHLMLGFSGGRKLIVPGVAAQETIKVIHSPRFIREPLSTEGSIEGNPLHVELLEAAALARHDFILDVTLTQEREISGVFAGNPQKAHAAGMEFMMSNSLTSVDGLADAVITSSAGYPLDLTFYQCLKGLTAAQHIVKPGGKMLLLAECAEGIGSPEYARLLKGYRGHAEFLKEIESTPVEIDQWQLEKLALVGLKNELLFYTPGAAREALGSLGANAFDRLDDAIAALVRDLAPGARVALLPEGPYTFARAMPAYA
ncbi:MAG: nickel-dependent lactate racemase [Terracidiphilus sp.]|nr:nickel-dependent lactate racemase [Terracidiphilus sp.]MDR3797192.1 nickel-dependent lactate racemase [Terracidiphilus sp.]